MIGNAEAWLIAGILLMLGEVFAPGAFLVWLGLAAVGTGLALLQWTLGFSAQVVLFAGLAALSIALGLRLRGARRPPALNTPGAGLVGRAARVLDSAPGELRVRVGDSDWPARLAAGAGAPAVDSTLVVLGVEGMILLVGPQA